MITHSSSIHSYLFLFFFNDTATTEIYTLSLHDALPILPAVLGLTGNASFSQSVPVHVPDKQAGKARATDEATHTRSEEHTSELQSHVNLVCRLLLEKKKKKKEIQHQTQHKSDNNVTCVS